MQLIYIYVKNLNRKIENQEINLSDDIKVCFKENNLKIVTYHKKIKDFWGAKIENINLFVGKNGVGKTTILDIIGMNNKTRKFNYNRSKYFMIYQVKDNLYYFVGSMKKEIKNLSSNLILNESFFFMVTKDGDLLEIHQNIEDRLSVYYNKTKVDYTWNAPKITYKDDNKRLLRYFNLKTELDDVMLTISKMNFLLKGNKAFRIIQKLNYSNNLQVLTLLYELEQENIDINENNKFFLNEDGIEKINSLQNKYNRKNQDEKFNGNDLKKDYFLLRILEKIYIKYFSDFVNIDSISMKKYKVMEYKFELINKIISIRKYSLENKDDINSRIKYLIKVLEVLIESLVLHGYRRYDIDLHQLIIYIEKLDRDYFLTNNIIEIPIQDENIFKDLANLINEFKGIFEFKFSNFSDGEYIYINLFSNILKSVLHSKKDCLILLDEPDINLHPEWARNFINDLVRLIENEKTEGKVQIIITTHSPFIVTDFPKENVFGFIENQKYKTEISSASFGFAANIYDVVNSTFFMNAPIGEFALRKIQSLKGNLNFNEKEKLINIIDDKFIRNHLKEELNEKYDQN